MLSERVCDGGIRWLAPSKRQGRETRNEKDWKGGGVWVGMGMPLVVLGDGGERGGEKIPAAAGVLRHCRRQTITAFE